MTTSDPGHVEPGPEAGPGDGWHARAAEEVLDRFDVDPGAGLSTAEAERRREEHGPNELAEAEDVMDRPPRPPDEGVVDARMLSSIGAVMTVTGLALFLAALAGTRDVVRARTLLFTFLVVETVRVQVIRSRYGASPLSNPWLLAAVATTLALQLLVLYTPVAGFFGVVPLSATGWTWIAAGFVALLALNLGAEFALDRTVPD